MRFFEFLQCFFIFKYFICGFCVFAFPPQDTSLSQPTLPRRTPPPDTLSRRPLRRRPRRRLWGRRCFTRQPENSKRAHLRVPALQTPPKFHETTPKRRIKILAVERKKARNFGHPTHRGPPPPDRPKFRFFSLSRFHFRSFFFSWESFRGILVVLFKRKDTQMCTFGLSGCRANSRRLLQNAKNNFTIDLLPSPQTSEKVNNQLLQILLASRKKTRTQPKFHWKTPLSPLGPTPLGPHFFWVVVSAVCAAPDSAARCCFCCCLCSCCGLLLPLLLLLLVLVSVVCAVAAAFFLLLLLPLLLLLGRRPSNPPLQCFALKNVKNNFTIDWNPLTSTNCDKLCWYPTEIPREHAPPLSPLSTLRGPTPLGLNFSGFGLPHLGLLADVVVKKNTLAAFDLPKCVYCFWCFLCCFCHVLLLLDAGFSCCVLFFLLFALLLLPLLRFTVVYGVAFVAAASCCCDCL